MSKPRLIYNKKKTRFISHTKTLIYIAFKKGDLYRMKNLDLYPLPKPRFTTNTITSIYIVYQNLELYRIPQPRFISYTNT
jgi:hypothetical protein